MSATPEDIEKYGLEFVQDIQSVETLVGTMAGYFSMCWEQPFSPSSEFLSQRAGVGLAVMMDRMEELVKERILAEYHRFYLGGGDSEADAATAEGYVKAFSLYEGASDDRR